MEAYRFEVQVLLLARLQWGVYLLVTAYDETSM